MLSTYKNSEDLINIGAYVKGSSEKIDKAVAYYDKIIAYLRQDVNENSSFKENVEGLKRIFQ
ncbi:Flagellum-specific ATP synthase [Clostridium ljungdahlii]|uniref:Flagellum-specific ATP synthase n=1 Tax=Clostridium ljungdahlii TaxID=1538 RepID=A0A162KJE8_9CLOT|nr:Flagellum-specific ATP synthase [Clostridium ljungdahlii]